jgi:hypothetical protein
MKIEAPFFRLWIKPGISAKERAEAAHALFRILIDPPRPRAERRRVVVLAALHLLSGSRSARAEKLARDYATYLSNGWLREQALEELPDPRAPQHALLWKLAKITGGRALGRRRLIDIASSPQA